MKKLLVALIFLVCPPLYPQQTHDFRNDAATFPFAEKDYLPGSCQTGQYARLTTTNLMYRCDSPNVWSAGFKAGSTVTGHGVPPASTCTVGHVGDVYSRDDAGAASSTFYVCGNTAPATYAWELGGGGGGGTGTVTSVATGCGTSGGTITTTGTLIAKELPNPQTGTTYTYADADCGKIVSHSNASAIAGTLPQANGSTFIAGWYMDVENTGAGTLTITPTTSTIDGAATLALATNQGARIVSDGTNYFTQRGKGSAGTVTSIGTTGPITGGTITTTGTIACATCTTSAASLTANQLVIGAGSQAEAALGSLGTTTTVYHGNAAGAGTFGSIVNGDIASSTIDLTAKVTGVLPVANGGMKNRQITLGVGASDIASTGTKACTVIAVAGTVVAARLIASALPTGANLGVDVKKVAFASYTGTAAASSITASAIPTILTSDSNPRYSDTTLTGWTTSIAANDVVCVSISTAPTGGATWATLELELN